MNTIETITWSTTQQSNMLLFLLYSLPLFLLNNSWPRVIFFSPMSPERLCIKQPKYLDIFSQAFVETKTLPFISWAHT